MFFLRRVLVQLRAKASWIGLEKTTWGMLFWGMKKKTY